MQAGVRDAAAAAAGACFPKHPALRSVPAIGKDVPAGRPKGVRYIAQELSDAAGLVSGVCLFRSAHSRMLGCGKREHFLAAALIQFDFVNATDDCLLPATMALK